MIIGRDKEKIRLNKLFLSKEAELLALYGRRRVGKTYLIREYFSKKKCFLMHVTGVDKSPMKTQLKKFSDALSQTFLNNIPIEVPKTWEAAFKLLDQQIKLHPKDKVVVFLDELPWLATRKSDLMNTLDSYWNQHWSQLKNLVVVLCGSSASWMIKNIIYNKGGLHNRISCEICLAPFSLAETKEFLNYRGVKLNQKHILSLYMALGGVPYYLKYVEPNLTAEENIQEIFFEKSAPLADEFNKLFQSLFNNAPAYIELIKLIAKHRKGLTRSELQTAAKLSTNGGRLSERLENLCRSGFLEEHIPWGKKTGEYYKVIDEFCLFYLTWVGAGKNKKFTRQYWLEKSRGQSYISWSGYTFEAVCFKHLEQVTKALNLKTAVQIDSWRFIPRKHLETGTQIDLLIDRTDNAITLCEIKYSSNPFVIDKSYAKNLENKINTFAEKTNTNKQIFLAIISAHGLKKNKYSEELISSVVTLDDLFKRAD